MSFSKHSPYRRALLIHTAFWWSAAASLHEIVLQNKSRNYKSCMKLQLLLILNSTIVPWNKKVIFKDLAMCSWSTQIPFICFIACGVGFFVPNVLPPRLTLRNLCTSWRMTMWNPCATDGHHEEAPCAMLVQSMDIVKKNHLVQSLCKFVNIVKRHLVKSLCNLRTSWRRITLCNLWTSWRIHHQFASLCICDAEIGVCCKEELLESWWWCDFLSVPVLIPRSSLHILGLYGGKNYPALWNFHCGHYRETKLVQKWWH